MHIFARTLGLASLLCLMSACTDAPPSAEERQPAADADNAPTQTSAAPVGINAPIPEAEIGLSFRLVAPPAYDSSKDAVTVRIEASNTGKVPLDSAGTHPVNVGLVVQGKDGTMKTPPAKLDFVRIPFPAALAPGDKVELQAVSFSAADALGGTVIVDGVQEGVSWFSWYGKPVLTIGQFIRCQDSEKTLCTAEGQPVALAP